MLRGMKKLFPDGLARVSEMFTIVTFTYAISQTDAESVIHYKVQTLSQTAASLRYLYTIIVLKLRYHQSVPLQCTSLNLLLPIYMYHCQDQSLKACSWCTLERYFRPNISFIRTCNC